jgi:integrase
MSIRPRQWRNEDGSLSSRWQYDYVDNGGKRRNRQFKLKRQAEAFRQKTETELAGGIHTANRASVAIQQASELWLTACEARDIERTTLDNYRRAKDQINAEIGAEKLNQLTTGKVKAFREKIAIQEKERGNTGGKVRQLMMVLGAILADAQERGLVAQNVVRMLVKKRGGDRLKRKLKVGVDIPTPDEIHRLIAQLDDPRFARWRVILLTFMFTGLRASEMRGLRKSDVDLDKGELHVRQRADAYKEIGATKTEGSQRTVPLLPTLVAVLREQMLRTPKTGHNLMFPTRNGGVIDDSTITERGLKPAQVAAGIVKPNSISPKHPKGKAKYSLHKLRHFYASLCINRKIDGGLEWPIKVVSERLGHASIRMTADTYGHLFPRGDDQAELAAADAMFFDNVPAPRPATAAVHMLKPIDNTMPDMEPMPVLKTIDKPAVALQVAPQVAQPEADDPVPAVGSATPRERAKAAILAYPDLDDRSICEKIGVSRQTMDRARGRDLKPDEAPVQEPNPITVAPVPHPTALNRTDLGRFMPGPWRTPEMERVEAAVRDNPDMFSRALAKQLGVDHGTVLNTKKRLGIKSTWVEKLASGMARVDAAVLANPNMPSRALAAQLGVNKATVLNARERLGIKSTWAENLAAGTNRVDAAVLDNPGMSSRKLAEQLGVGLTTVKRAKRRLKGQA